MARVSAHDDLATALTPCAAVMESIEQHVDDGRLGVKSGRGFYDDNDQRVAELASKLYRVARQLDSDSA